MRLDTVTKTTPLFLFYEYTHVLSKSTLGIQQNIRIGSQINKSSVYTKESEFRNSEFSLSKSFGFLTLDFLEQVSVIMMSKRKLLLIFSKLEFLIFLPRWDFCVWLRITCFSFCVTNLPVCAFFRALTYFRTLLGSTTCLLVGALA